MGDLVRPHDHGMSTASNRRITLTLEAGADPIRGSIEHADGSQQPFWGWLELSEKLGRIAADEPDRKGRPAADRSGPSRK